MFCTLASPFYHPLQLLLPGERRGRGYRCGSIRARDRLSSGHLRFLRSPYRPLLLQPRCARIG